MSSGNSSSAAGSFDLDHAYLRSTVAAPLTEAMAQLAILQPEDPVEYLGNYLLKFVENELENQRMEELKKASPPPSSSRTNKSAQYPGNNNSSDGLQTELDQACCSLCVSLILLIICVILLLSHEPVCFLIG